MVDLALASPGDEWKNEWDGSGDGWLMVTRAPGTGRSGRGGLGSGARELRGGGNCWSGGSAREGG